MRAIYPPHPSPANPCSREENYIFGMSSYEFGNWLSLSLKEIRIKIFFCGIKKAERERGKDIDTT